MKSEYLDGFRRLRFLHSSKSEANDREKINKIIIMRNNNTVAN
jgi:hypothetical protein